MNKNTSIRSIVVRAAIGSLLHASAFGGPSSYMYSQGYALSYKPIVNPVRTSARRIFHKQAGRMRWSGMSRLFNAGQGVISIDEFDR
jgi:hypothetical protein